MKLSGLRPKVTISTVGSSGQGVIEYSLPACLLGCVQGANYDGGGSKARNSVAVACSVPDVAGLGHVLAFVTAHAYNFAKLRQFVIVVVLFSICSCRTLKYR